MPPVGFEPTISAGERPQTYALDRAAPGTGKRRTGEAGNPRALICEISVSFKFFVRFDKFLLVEHGMYNFYCYHFK